MIDFISLDITEAVKRPCNFFAMDFYQMTNHDTGEYKNKLVCNAGQWTFIRHEVDGKPSGRIKMYGSLHKHHEDGFNYSDFKLQDVLYSLIDVCEGFQINPSKAKVLKIEAGVNIHTPYPPSILIQNAFSVSGRSTMFADMTNSRHQIIGKELAGTDHRIKLYNKSHQLISVEPMMRGQNIIRFEDHYSRVRPLTKLAGVQVLADLFNFHCMHRISCSITSHSDQIIFLNESPDNRILTYSEKKIISNWSNPTLVKQVKESNSRRFRYELSIYRGLTKNNSQNPSYQFRKLVESKSIDLMQATQAQVRAAQIYLQSNG